MDKDDNQCREAGRGDAPTDPQLDPAGYEQDDYDYVLLDAWASDDKARYAPFMTDEYTHPDVADYTEECTDADGNTWTWNMCTKVQQVCWHTFIMQTVYYTRMKQTHGENPV